MAISYGPISTLASTTGSTSWSHAGGTSIALAVVVLSGGAVDETSGVTYGGVDMVREVTAANTGGESGTTSIWTLESPPTGTQTVAVTRSGATAYIGAAHSVNSATGHAYVVDGQVFTATATSAPEVTLTLGGVQSAIIGGLYSGENALTSISQTGHTVDIDNDFGNFCSRLSHITALQSGSTYVYAFTQSNDDAALAAIAVAEASAPTTESGSFTADAYIQKADIPGSFSADAYIQTTTQGSFTADASVSATVSNSFTADAYISTTYPGSFTADAYIASTTQNSFTADAYIYATAAGNFSADAYIQNTVAGSFTADGHIASTVVGSFTADAYIQGTAPTVPVWVSPPDTSTVNATPVFVFTIPDGPAGNYHFNMEIDTAATFDTGNLRSLRSHVDQTGWEYDSTGGGGWTPVPSSGVPSTFAGNDARYTVQTPLASGTWYRRVRAGV